MMAPIKILIVEDEQLVADDLRETLEYLGYAVLALTSTGEEAILLVESLKPDLVLMDICLEGEVDGIEASGEILSRFHIPVVYLTANADKGTLERVKCSQPFGYILKPFDEMILATTIDIALGRHHVEVEVKKALATAQADKQAAESQTQLKSHYLYMAAHEFRNPLTTIQLGAEILKNYSHQMSEEKKQLHLQRIEAATESLNYLLEDILTLGKAEAGKLECHRVPMDVVTFCQEMVESLRWSLTDQNTLKFAVDGEYRIACLDEHLLWHLLNNLLTNAIKYSPLGGVIFFRLIWEENRICFQIQDQGIGIPQPALAKLFEPFQRASNVGNIPGTGLGLAIVKQCVDLHGGTIEVDSVVGQGTNFIIRLPINHNYNSSPI